MSNQCDAGACSIRHVHLCEAFHAGERTCTPARMTVASFGGNASAGSTDCERVCNVTSVCTRNLGRCNAPPTNGAAAAVMPPATMSGKCRRTSHHPLGCLNEASQESSDAAIDFDVSIIFGIAGISHPANGWSCAWGHHANPEGAWLTRDASGRHGALVHPGDAQDEGPP